MKTCGVCKWFPVGGKPVWRAGDDAGECQSPVPMWVTSSFERDPIVFGADTADECPMFEPREDDAK